MTRINGNIKPKDLIDQHLLAEYRELVRIPNAYHKNPVRYLESSKSIPDTFVLGKGHVKYFYNKLKFLHKRFLDLKIELISRGFKTNIDDFMFYNLPIELYGDLNSIEINFANKVVSKRITDNISTMSGTPRIYSENISKEVYSSYLLEKYG